MNIEEFKKRGYEMIDFICDYFKNLENYPVLSKVKPGEITSKLPTEMPDEGENWDKIMKDVKEIVIPGLTLWQHPNFYGFYPLAFSFPAVLGDLLSTGLGVQGMLWLTSPACTEIETVTLDWLAKLLSLPEKFLSTKEGGGVIQGTASEGTLVSMIAARHKKLKEMLINEENEEIIKSKLIAYTSDQAHSSVKKACLIMGISLNNFRIINSPDGLLEFSPEELEKEIIKDLKNNLIPFFVSTTIGTTSTSAVDPISKIGDICEKYNIWLHVDAAYAGSACICEEYRHYLNGIEKASSFLFNPHKWLLVNFDCSTLWVTNRNILIDSLSVVPEYLRNTASISGKVIDYRDWQIPLGRRFRALKLWFVLCSYGKKGLKEHIRKYINMAENLENWILKDSLFEIVQPRKFALLCIRMKSSNEKNQLLLEKINESGKAFLSHTIINKQYIIRISIGSFLSNISTLEEFWKFFQTEAHKIYNQ